MNFYTTASEITAAPSAEEADPADIMAAIAKVRDEIDQRRERDLVALLFDPRPVFSLWPKPTVEALSESPASDRMRFTIGWHGLVMGPKHSLLMITDAGYAGPPELRCGPYTTPAGKQWAVVRDRDTGRRRVVDWPL